MMRDSVKEFVDKELWAHKDRFEKRLCLYGGVYEKSRRFRSLGVAVPEAYGGLGMGFVNDVGLRLHSGATGSFSTAFGAHTGIGTMPITLYGTEAQKTKYVPKLASGEWFEPTALLNQELDLMPTQENKSRFIRRRKVLFD
jgi:alkylation response protein AidB-like acyl-CoA dehydrogenase